MDAIGAIGCNVVALVDSVAFRRLSSAESRAIADGVKRTLLLFPISATRLFNWTQRRDVTCLGDGALVTRATGALLNGCRSSSPYTLRGGLNLGAAGPPAVVPGADISRAAPGCGTRDENVMPDGSMPSIRCSLVEVPGMWRGPRGIGGRGVCVAVQEGMPGGVGVRSGGSRIGALFEGQSIVHPVRANKNMYSTDLW